MDHVAASPTVPERSRRPSPALRAALGLDEHSIQVALFNWAELATAQHPELALLFAVPNFAGFHGSRLARIRSGARSKAEGRKRGVPDVILPVARGGYHGLYLEIKAEDNRSSKEALAAQKAWRDALNAAGNLAVVCVGFEHARAAITTYLTLSKV